MLGHDRSFKTTNNYTNHIKFKVHNHRQFLKLIEEIEENDWSCSTVIRWISRGKVLKLFSNLKNHQNIFTLKDSPLVVLLNNEWLWELALNIDLSKQMNDLSLKL
ncbi:hypothetical protein CWI37_0165p0020 [Hamiltosporidium tvaerminnensis]|uniref:Uncharacterized protein n=1 Tax=Hamiltosporidium tvaerminnensis TaxID=1176355 RepID=A0A4Q9L919_9MICR|nr:hypothetical protein CWI37_0165p0020 [Hamiltosporidium tvaerminnensis]